MTLSVKESFRMLTFLHRTIDGNKKRYFSHVYKGTTLKDTNTIHEKSKSEYLNVSEMSQK